MRLDVPVDPGAPTMAGEYEIRGRIAKGGMGTVYLGVHPIIGKRVAIKVLDTKAEVDDPAVLRFMQEACAVNKIGHPNIIDIFSFGQLADGRHFYVMELLEGESLKTALARTGPMVVDDVIQVALPLCNALSAAHAKGIIHRDLKPENVFLSQRTAAWKEGESNGGFIVKLLDFGVAKLTALDAGNTTRSGGAPLGTPVYMAPEQCHGGAIDERVDVYGLGVLLYQMLTGRLPYHGETFIELLTHKLTDPPPLPSTLVSVPPAFEAIVMRCLELDPGRRPSSMREMHEELSSAHRAGASLRVRTPDTLPRQRPRSWRRAHIWRRAGQLAQLAAVIGGTWLILAMPKKPVASPSLPKWASAAAARPVPVEDRLSNAPKMASEPGFIVVTTSVPKAEFVLNGKDREAENGVLQVEVPSGQHRVEVRAKGYRPWSDTVFVTSGRIASRHAALERSKPRPSTFKQSAAPAADRAPVPIDF